MISYFDSLITSTSEIIIVFLSATESPSPVQPVITITLYATLLRLPLIVKTTDSGDDRKLELSRCASLGCMHTMRQEVAHIYLRILHTLLTLALFLEYTMGSQQCEVTNITVASDEEASTYSFNLTLRDSSCTDRSKLSIRLEYCNGTRLFACLRAQDEHKTLINYDRGTWKVAVRNSVSGTMKGLASQCFNSKGLRLTPTIFTTLNYKSLHIYLSDVDPRVISWRLKTYEIKKKGEAAGCEKWTLYQVKKKFHMNPLAKPHSVSKNSINMTHDFDPDGCYCFVIYVISNYSLKPSRIPVNTTTCRPVPPLPQDGQQSIGLLPLTRAETVGMFLWVGLMVVTVVVGVSLLLLGILYRPQCLSLILALSLRPPDTKKKSASRRPMLQDTQVLLLHGRDISGTEDLAKLKKFLSADCKVYGIFDNSDPERLADPAGWLQAMVLKEPRVKVLLVESAALKDQMNTLGQTCSVTDKVGTAASVCDGDALLTFALRHILCTKLWQDYSRVFVVRLTDDQQQGCLQDEDGVNLMVRAKRYNLPCHSSSLREDILR